MDMIGSGKLSRENLPKDRLDLLDGIESQINKFRKNAFDEEVRFKCGNKVKDKDRPNNVISILGGRGSGKTSVALTINNKLNEQNSNHKKIKDEKSKKHLDFILGIIDPSKFNVEDNALGRIIYSFESYINELKEEKTENDNYCTNKKGNNLSAKYEKLKGNYIYSRKFYRQNLASITESRYEYDKINQDIILADKNLEDSFREFIEELCCVNRELCNKYNNEKENVLLEDNEPLIFITFDDVDMCPEKGPEILDLILNYLSHSNIVCIVLGDYSTFSEALVIDLWKRSNIPVQLGKDTMANNNNTLFNGIVRRADDILGKVLPYNYRFELKDLALIDRLKFTPFGKGDMPELYKLLENINIVQADSKSKNKKSTTLLKYFIEPLIDINAIMNKIHNIDLTGNKRRYNGYDSDVEENTEYNNLVLKYKEIVSNIYNESEIREQNNETKESEKEIQLKIKKNEVLKSFKVFNYAYVLSGNPRGLINLYYKLKSIVDSKREFQFSNLSRYGIQQNIYLNNYKIYTELFEAFYNSNIDISSNNDELDIRKVLKLNKEHSTIEVNKNNLTLLGSIYYNYLNFNVSTNLLSLNYSENFQLSNEKSAFIQLFYDLAKIFLGNKIAEEEEWNFEKVCIYRRNEDLIEYTSIDFKYFYDFYYFQRLYKACLPLIIRDRKVHIDIRNRLKALSLSIIKCISEDEVRGKKRFIEEIYNIEKLDYYIISDVKNKLNTINNIAENYFPNNGISNFLDSDNIIHETLSGREQEYYKIGDLNDLLESSKYHLVYNEILSISDNSKKQRVQRCKEIRDIINTLESNVISENRNLIEILRYAEDENWEMIRDLLIEINEDIANFLIYKICESGYIDCNEKVKLFQLIKDISQRFYDTINKNNQAATAIGLDTHTKLQEALNKFIDRYIKLQKESVENFDNPLDLYEEMNEIQNKILAEDVIVEDVLIEFIKKSQVREAFKNNTINKLKSIENNIIIERYNIKDINTDNFKEKMREILKLKVERFIEQGAFEMIDSLIEVATEVNKELIRNIQNSYKEEEKFEL